MLLIVNDSSYIQKLFPTEIGPIRPISEEDVLIQKDWTNFFGVLCGQNYFRNQNVKDSKREK